jgi:polyhydroxyalkanoate synthesis regulator phasin
MQKIAAGAVAVLAVGIAGGAVAATRLSTPEQESKAVVNDAARRLGVTPQELTSAFKEAMKAQVDQAVKEGRLTKTEGARIKERIDANDFPLFGLGRARPGGPPGHHVFGFRGGLDAAASYLGMTETALRTQLESGKTLAQVAKAKGKSVDGLVDAIMADKKQALDQAVKNGDLTRAEANKILAEMRSRTTDLVNGRGLGGRPHLHVFGFHHGLDAAASYLGMTEAALRTQLESGKTLARVAEAKGKSVNGLVDALMADKKQAVDQAVKNGDLTQAQADRALAEMRSRTTDMVNGRMRFRRLKPGFGFGFGGPPIEKFAVPDAPTY